MHNVRGLHSPNQFKIVNVSHDAFAFADSGSITTLVERPPAALGGCVELRHAGCPGRMSYRDLFVHNSPKSADLDERLACNSLRNPLLTYRLHDRSSWHGLDGRRLRASHAHQEEGE